MTAPTTRCTDAARFLALLHEPGDVFEIRAFKCPERSGGSFTSTASGYFNNPADAAREAKRLDKLNPPGVYVTINSVQPALLARSANECRIKAKATTSDPDIVRRRWLLVDIDPSRPAEVSATDAEMQAALLLANEIRQEMRDGGHRWPDPLCACSGNGGHLLYRIDLPNDDDATDLVKRTLHALAHKFDRPAASIDTSTFNASRIAKVLGTYARKGESLRGVAGVDDRPHRVSWFKDPGESPKVLASDLMEEFAAKHGQPKSVAPKASGSAGGKGKKSKKGAGPSSPIDRCRTYLEKIADSIQGEHGSDPLFYAASVCARFDLNESESLQALADYNATKCHPPWDEKDLTKKISDARRDVEAKGEVGSMNHDAPAVAPGFTMHDEICRRLQIDVLGEWAEDRAVEIYSYHHRKSRRIRDVGRMKFPDLLQLCGDPAAKAISNTAAPVPDKFTIGQVREAIGFLAGRTELDNDSMLGMGCWRGKDDAGNPTGSVVIVNARQAGVWNGEFRLEKIDHPRHGGLLLRIANSSPWVDLERLVGLCEAAADPAWCEESLGAMRQEFERWTWAQPSAPELLSGLVAATWIQSLWDWRPQISITGQSNTGKTFLFATLEAIFGDLAENLASDSTARGIQQSVGGDSRVLLIDEWDRLHFRHREEILSMIRRSSRGVKRAVGQQSQKARVIGMRNIWWTAGITSNISDEADRNRFISFELARPPAEKHGKLKLRPRSELAEMGMRLLAIAIRHGIAAARMASELTTHTVEGLDARFMESYAVPVAIVATSTGMAMDDALSLLREHLAVLESTGEQNVVRDEESLLEAILASHVDAGRDLGRRSVSQLIDDIRDPHSMRGGEAEEALAKVGVAVRRDEITAEWTLVVAPNVAQRHLLRATTWEGKTIREVLRRIPEAACAIRRIGGTAFRCYIIPFSSKVLATCFGV